MITRNKAPARENTPDSVFRVSRDSAPENISAPPTACWTILPVKLATNAPAVAKAPAREMAALRTRDPAGESEPDSVFRVCRESAPERARAPPTACWMTPATSVASDPAVAKAPAREMAALRTRDPAVVSEPPVDFPVRLDTPPERPSAPARDTRAALMVARAPEGASAPDKPFLVCRRTAPADESEPAMAMADPRTNVP